MGGEIYIEGYEEMWEIGRELDCRSRCMWSTPSA
jgi:hypothetical protein